MLSLHSSCHVSQASLKTGLNPYVFPLAIVIAQGVQFMLASLYLGFMYARLNQCVGNIVRAVGVQCSHP